LLPPPQLPPFTPPLLPPFTPPLSPPSPPSPPLAPSQWISRYNLKFPESCLSIGCVHCYSYDYYVNKEYSLQECQQESVERNSFFMDCFFYNENDSFHCRSAPVDSLQFYTGQMSYGYYYQDEAVYYGYAYTSNTSYFAKFG
jgi:hypothetical protein